MMKPAPPLSLINTILLALGLTIICVTTPCQCIGSMTPTGGINSRQTAISKAFVLDGFTVKRWVEFRGQFGALAEAVNATVLSTGLPKRAYYVEGQAYEMGYLMGLMATPEATRMTVDYVDRFLLSLLAPKWVKAHANTTLYADLSKILGWMLTKKTTKLWNEQVGSGVWPSTLIDEMKGLVAACRHVAGSNCQITFDRVVALNTGIDWISSAAFTGKFLHELRMFVHENAARIPLSAAKLNAMLDPSNGLAKSLFRAPAFCDAFGAYKRATRTGSGAFYARDFQLPTASVFQEVNAMTVYVPSDGRLPVVSASAPGMIGSITALNIHGVAVGVDTLRSADGDADAPGFNSALLVRHTADTSPNSGAAVDTIADARRGCVFLYSACDSHGECTIIEAGMYHNASNPLDPLALVTNTNLKELLPDHAFLAAHNSSAIERNGVYVRNASYQWPREYLKFNEALFKRAKVPYNSSAWGPSDFVFQSFEAENEATKTLLANFFAPVRCTDQDFVLVSNSAYAPELHITQMAPWADLLDRSAHAMFWRYDSLHAQLQKRYGTIDIEAAKEIITFLSPDRTPGYWMNRLYPNEPMSAEIEGSISACDLTKREIWTKAGYWADNWTKITLPHYVIP